MNDVLSTLGHSAIWSAVRLLAREHPALVVPLLVVGVLLLWWARYRSRRAVR